jgi:hypothetical protein
VRQGGGCWQGSDHGGHWRYGGSWHGSDHSCGDRACAFVRGKRGEVLQVDSVDISSILFSAFLARFPPASQQLLLVASTMAFTARSVACEPREVFRNTMSVGPNNTSGKGNGSSKVLSDWGSHIGRGRCNWGDLNILSCRCSGCGCQRHLLAEFLRLLHGWRVVSSLRVLSPSSCQSLPLKRVRLRLNLLCYACGRSQGNIRSGRGDGCGTSDRVDVLRHAEVL